MMSRVVSSSVGLDRQCSRGGRRIRAWCGHGLRLAVVAVLAWLVHVEHGAFLRRRVAAGLDDVPLDLVRRHLPEAAAVGGAAPGVEGGRDLLDSGGDRVGTFFRTSPAGDAVIGFSGPTDLLVVCSADLRVAGVEILSSRDTRDHVAAVRRDPGFLASFRGRSLDELAAAAEGRADAVAGSTLTCSAIAEAVALRLGAAAGTSRFAAPPALADLRRVFPDAVRIAADATDPGVLRVYAADDIPLGWGLRTSPAGDLAIGYQGPTDAVVCFGADGTVAGVVVAATFDNEPYAGYVRDDRAFGRLWRGQRIEQLAGIDPDATGVEGVSGATMTSRAVAEAIVRAVRHHADRGPPAGVAGLVARTGRIEPAQWGTLAVIALGIATAFTRLRGSWLGRVALPVVVLGWLGFGAGGLLSQAQVWGWIQSGPPRGAVVLAALALAAFVLPATTRRNVYCSHLCGHGAAQQLLARFARPRGRPPEWLRPWLAGMPWALLAVAILTAVLHLPLALVDLEPFDAYLPAVAGGCAIVIFAASLAASAVVPMAYCRHGCPTGALLDHLRLHGRSGRFTWRDGVMLGCLAVAATVHWWPR